MTPGCTVSPGPREGAGPYPTPMIGRDPAFWHPALATGWRRAIRPLHQQGTVPKSGGSPRPGEARHLRWGWGSHVGLALCDRAPRDAPQSRT
eukprot:552736-Hanusia_phi.AAC.1